MTKRFQETGNSQILVEQVPHDQVDKYGVVDCSGVEIPPGKQQLLKQW
jgi:UTP--glucose-1-phosphate uridylyltransferase